MKPSARVLPGEASSRIPGLDGLRALSIALVLFGHLAGTRGFISVQTYETLGDSANLGVRVFFVISGYLITGILLRELGATGKISLPLFYFRRTLRIFPAAYFFVLCVVLLSLVGFTQVTGRGVVSALAYVSNFRPGGTWDTAHLWSLAVEEQFYLVWPASLAVLGKRRAMVVCLALVTVVFPLSRFVWVVLKEHRDVLGYIITIDGDSLLCGCLLAGGTEFLAKQPRYQAFLRGRWFYAVPILVLAANAVPHHWYWMLFCLPVINVGIVMCLDRWTRPEQDGISRFLNHPMAVRVGVLSYSLYLWQQIFLNREQQSPLTSFPVNIVLAFVCAVLSHRLVEKPALRMRAYLEARYRVG